MSAQLTAKLGNKLRQAAWFGLTVFGTLQTGRNCVLALAALGCGEHIIDHGNPDFSTSVFGDEVGGFVSSIGDGGFFGDGGNFPEPAQTRCGSLPAGVTPIDHLASSWGVLAIPGARDDGGQPIANGSVRLRFANRPMQDCAGGFAAAEDAFCGWDSTGSFFGFDEPCLFGIGLSLTADELQPGVYAIDELTNPQYATEVAESGVNQSARNGELELFRVTDDCIVGELRDITVFEGEPVQDGGFVAQVCQRQCVPGPGHGC